LQNDDLESGCGFQQPIYRSKGLEITAEFKGQREDDASSTVILTPETVLNIFKRIDDEDCESIGNLSYS